MPAKVFKNNEKDYLRWIEKNRNGFVLNTSKKISHEFKFKYLVLHKATCKTIRKLMKNMEYGAFTERGYIKVCANSQAELLRWIGEQGGNRFTNRCSKCNPEGSIENETEYYKKLEKEVKRSQKKVKKCQKKATGKCSQNA